MKYKIITYYALVNSVTLIFLFKLLIVINSVKRFGRIPEYRDAIYSPRQPIFSWQFDEDIILIGHFFSPILLFTALIISYFIGEKKYFIIVILVSIVEIISRFSSAYSYILYD